MTLRSILKDNPVSDKVMDLIGKDFDADLPNDDEYLDRLGYSDSIECDSDNIDSREMYDRFRQNIREGIGRRSAGPYHISDDVQIQLPINPSIGDTVSIYNRGDVADYTYNGSAWNVVRTSNIRPSDGLQAPTITLTGQDRIKKTIKTERLSEFDALSRSIEIRNDYKIVYEVDGHEFEDEADAYAFASKQNSSVHELSPDTPITQHIAQEIFDYVYNAIMNTIMQRTVPQYDMRIITNILDECSRRGYIDRGRVMRSLENFGLDIQMRKGEFAIVYKIQDCY